MALDLLRGKENHFFTISDDGTSTPTTLLNDLVIIGTTTSLTRNHAFKCLVVTASATITLPAGVTVFSGWTVYIKNASSSDTVTVQVQAGETIITEGSTSVALTPGQFIMLVSGGNNRDGNGQWAAMFMASPGNGSGPTGSHNHDAQYSPIAHNHDAQYSPTSHIHSDLRDEDIAINQRVDELVVALGGIPNPPDLTPITDSLRQLREDIDDILARLPTSTRNIARSALDSDGLVDMKTLAQYGFRRPNSDIDLIIDPTDSNAWEFLPNTATFNVTKVHDAGSDGYPGFWRIEVTNITPGDVVSIYIDFKKAAVTAGIEYSWRSMVRVEDGTTQQLIAGVEINPDTTNADVTSGDWESVIHQMVLTQDQLDRLADDAAEVYLKFITLTPTITILIARPELIDLRALTHPFLQRWEISLRDRDGGQPRSYTPNNIADTLAFALPRYALSRDQRNLTIFDDPFFWGNEPGRPPEGIWTIENCRPNFVDEPERGPFSSSWIVTRVEGNQTDPANRVMISRQFANDELPEGIWQVTLFVSGSRTAVAANRSARVEAIADARPGVPAAVLVSAEVELGRIVDEEWQLLTIQINVTLALRGWQLVISADLLDGEFMYISGARIDEVITRISEDELVRDVGLLGQSRQVRNWSVADIQLMLNYYLTRFSVPVSPFSAEIWRDTALWTIWHRNRANDNLKPVGPTDADGDYRPDQDNIVDDTLTADLAESPTPGPLPYSYNRSRITTSDGQILLSLSFDAAIMRGVGQVVLAGYILYELDAAANLAPADSYFFISHGRVGTKPIVLQLGVPTSFTSGPGVLGSFQWFRWETPPCSVQGQAYYIRFVGKLGPGHRFRLANLTAVET